ncbi:hypothetical protein [Nocardiopsis sp. NPDC006938]|uniref:hypothetical protein n=1 Tax=Nocardiopsis sp. NPDC006938 TaxID=3364337 RepID=UPI00369228AD
MEVHTGTRGPGRAPLPPAAVGGPVVLVIGLTLALVAWNDPVPDPDRHRIFLSLWFLGAAVLAVRLFLDGLPSAPFLPRCAVTFGIGVVGAASAATMPWSDLGSVFWYQLWFSVPLLTGLAYAAFGPGPTTSAHGPDPGPDN